MNKRKMLNAAIAAVGAMVMCGNALAQTDQTTTNMTSTNHMGVNDQIMLMQVGHANVLEWAMGMMAARKAATRAVSEYGMMMAEDHSKAQDMISSTYGSQPWYSDWQTDMKKRWNLPYPERWYGQEMGDSKTMGMLNRDSWMWLDASDWDKIHELEGLNGLPFDKAYIRMQVMMHSDLLRKLQRSNDLSTNSDFKSWEGNVISTVQSHLDRARGISFDLDDPFFVQRSWPWIH